MTVALTLEANPEFVGVAACGVLAVFILFWKRTTRVESKLVSIEAGVERIDQAVNCTPPEKPPIKENAETAAVHSVATFERLDKVEADVAAAGEHALEARRLSARALARVGEIKTDVGNLNSKLDRVLEGGSQ